MAKRVKDSRAVDIGVDAPEATMLDVLDHLLNKGVVATGDLTLGVAGVDLIYLRLSALLCAADHVLPRHSETPRPRWRHRQPGAKRPK
jgi:gas vesicle structural protein